MTKLSEVQQEMIVHRVADAIADQIVLMWGRRISSADARRLAHRAMQAIDDGAGRRVLSEGGEDGVD